MKKTSDVENLLTAMMPGGIEAQEARGQKEFVRSTVLPKRFNYCSREQFESMGIVFADDDDDDDLFINCLLPAGWKKEPTGHSMWSNLVDDKGRKRASIFYKAAFYDRDAFIGITSRFNVQMAFYDSDGNTAEGRPATLGFIATDCGEEVFCSGKMGYEEHDEEKQNQLKQTCVDWLKERYPNWEDPLTYWEAV